MAPFFQKTRTATPVSPGTSVSGGLRRRSEFDPSGFDAPVDRSKPPQLTPAKGMSPPFESRFDVNKVMNNIDKQIGTNTGVDALIPYVGSFDQNQSSGRGMGVATNLAQQVLGNAYPQAISLGYKPSELIDMVTKAQGYNRGIDVDLFKDRLKRFINIIHGDAGNFLNVQRPDVTANQPTLGEAFQDAIGGISNMMGAGADFVMGGGTLGNIVSGLKDKFSQGKEIVRDFTNPMDITGKLADAEPEVRRKYALYLSQGIPYQQAYQMATGQKLMAMGGITSLN